MRNRRRRCRIGSGKGVGLIMLMVVGSSVLGTIVTLLSRACDHNPLQMTAPLSSLTTMWSQIFFSSKGSTGNARVDAIKQVVKLAEDDESLGDGAKALSASAEAEAKSMSATAKIRDAGGLVLRSWCHGRDRLVASLFV